jgi:hypothetical protein
VAESLGTGQSKQRFQRRMVSVFACGITCTQKPKGLPHPGNPEAKKRCGDNAKQGQCRFQGGRRIEKHIAFYWREPARSRISRKVNHGKDPLHELLGLGTLRHNQQRHGSTLNAECDAAETYGRISDLTSLLGSLMSFASGSRKGYISSSACSPLHQSQINRPMCASGFSPKGTMHFREKVVFFACFVLQADLRAISPKGMCAGIEQKSEITTLSYTGELISVQINRGFARTHVWNMSIDVHLSLRGCS